MDELNSKKWARDDVKRLRDDLFLNDSDSLPLNHDLASVMKSFKEEMENPNYDSFEFGFVDNFNDGTVVYDGLLKYSEVYYDSSDISGQLWLFETLSVE
ncbi:hypothetical protein ES288_D12G200300v1 [Gossypium darwinii]|uniref:Uncharacterized protein n=2 Tax=Gossypium TaxID=3633 RepID=A0A5D2ID02_GOSTO|nr:hypothetical protein ES288_D12G200300v1 [Gossypium darwinii]TYH39789.1 hypothetical protein ES332_D12G201000v1 [Gossypium tomentosum]